MYGTIHYEEKLGLPKKNLEVIQSNMSSGGFRLGLPSCSLILDFERLLSEHYDVYFSEDAPIRKEEFSVVILKNRKQKLEYLLEGLTEEYQFPEKRALRNQIEELDSIIEKRGIVETKIYGEFLHEPKPKVVLYWGNIRKDKHPYQALEATFVHELFHAWNYFCSGCRPRCIPEIDEAFVEYATLCFLERISQFEDPYADYEKSEFQDVFKWQLRTVEEKQKGVGLYAAYGFGEYIFKTDTQKGLLGVYPFLSGKISSDDPDVQRAVSMLSPFYPKENEKSVLKHTIDALFRHLQADECAELVQNQYIDALKNLQVDLTI
ncbi:MAG: hypothetical protein IJK79_08020 [Bacteroidales bacterium]|nr:hypothetical protein [Bacteroidales bacterium]